MLARLQRALLVVLVCILPVQSMAAALVTLTCPPQDAHRTVAAEHGTHDHAGHAHGDGAQQPGGAGHEHANDGHLCCHQFSSAGPSVHALAAPNDFRVYAAVVPVLTPLYIPELPQRPPRA